MGHQPFLDSVDRVGMRGHKGGNILLGEVLTIPMVMLMLALPNTSNIDNTRTAGVRGR